MIKQLNLATILIILVIFSGCSNIAGGGYDSAAKDSVPNPDHIIFVWFENKGYDRIIGSPSAPFINSLIPRGTLFNASYALTHPSYPNYIRFFSGQSNRINSNNCINNSNLTSKNLYTELAAAGKSFAWYSEGLPEMGSKICVAGRYVEKHNPVTIFANVPDHANKPLSAFPTDFKKLQNVVCITPDMINDMHDGTIQQGDTWLKENFSALIDWCEKNNSIFVIYWDESETQADNRIPVIAVGGPVKKNYKSNVRYDHYSWTKTAAALFKTKSDWTVSLKNARLIKDCWLFNYK